MGAGLGDAGSRAQGSGLGAEGSEEDEQQACGRRSWGAMASAGVGQSERGSQGGGKDDGHPPGVHPAPFLGISSPRGLQGGLALAKEGATSLVSASWRALSIQPHISPAGPALPPRRPPLSPLPPSASPAPPSAAAMATGGCQGNGPAASDWLLPGRGMEAGAAPRCSQVSRAVGGGPAAPRPCTLQHPPLARGQRGWVWTAMPTRFPGGTPALAASPRCDGVPGTCPPPGLRPLQSARLPAPWESS